MGMNKLVFAALSVGCLLAAGAGGFLAVRLAQPAPQATLLPANPAAPAVVPSAADPVQPGAPGSQAGMMPSAPAAPEAAPAVSPVATRVPAAPPAPVQPPPPTATPGPRPGAPVRVATRVGTSAGSRPASRPAPSSSRETSETTAVASPVVIPTLPPATAPAPGPASGSPVPQNAGTMWESRQPVQAETPMVAETVPEPPPAPQYVELTVPRDAVLGLQIERTVSSENARTEDRVTARVTRDVRVGNRIAIPAGSLVTGSVLDVDRGGRVRGRSRLSIRFHTLTLSDGTDITLRTDPVIREGQSASGESAAKVGGAAIGGAILGAILGGQRGAAVGAGIGAAGGTAAAMTNTPDAARLSAGTTITLRMQEQLIVSVPRD